MPPARWRGSANLAGGRRRVGDRAVGVVEGQADVDRDRGGDARAGGRRYERPPFGAAPAGGDPGDRHPCSEATAVPPPWRSPQPSLRARVGQSPADIEEQCVAGRTSRRRRDGPDAGAVIVALPRRDRRLDDGDAERMHAGALVDREVVRAVGDADAGARRPAPRSAAPSTARAAWERWTGHGARRDDEIMLVALVDAVDAELVMVGRDQEPVAGRPRSLVLGDQQRELAGRVRGTFRRRREGRTGSRAGAARLPCGRPPTLRRRETPDGTPPAPRM